MGINKRTGERSTHTQNTHKSIFANFITLQIHFSFSFIYFMAKITFDLETSSEFFVGNLNKTKTRDEIFQDLTKIYIDCLNEYLYISKFNMPKFNARKDQDGTLLLNLGYAFVTTKKPEMAQELIRKKRMKLDDGSDIEFKPINRNKRLVANQNCKEKNISKINDVTGTRKRSDEFGVIGDWRKQVQPAKPIQVPELNLFGNFSRAPASIQRNDSYGKSPFLWPQFNESNNSSSELEESNISNSPSIFDICKPANTETTQNRSFRRNPICSAGSDKDWS